jgi:hypothetical protein
VVGGEDDEVAFVKAGFELRYAAVERLEARGIAGHVASVTIERVEVDEVTEEQGPVPGALQGK